MDNRIFELADQLKLLKEVKKEYEAKVKDLTAEIESLDRELSDAMAEAECERFSRNGSTFYLNSRLFASPASGLKDAIRVLEGVKDIAICRLTSADVVRHALVQEIINAYEKAEKKGEISKPATDNRRRYQRKKTE